MYELVEEATKVLREPTSHFDFENPPECPKEIEKNLSQAMERFGGIGLSANQLGLMDKKAQYESLLKDVFDIQG